MFLGLSLPTLNPFLSTAIDDASYILLSRSLAQGLGYRDIAYVGKPAHCHYPPVLPLLLCPLVKCWPNSVLPLKLFVLASGLVLVLASRRIVGPGESRLGWLVALLVATNPMVIALSGNVFSYIPHGALILVYLVVLRHASAGRRAWTKRWSWACVLLATMYLVRPVTIAMFGATVVFLIIHRRLRQLFAIGLIFVTAVGVWQVRNHWLSQRDDAVYGEHFSVYLKGLRKLRAAGPASHDLSGSSVCASVARGFAQRVCHYGTSVAAGLAAPFFLAELGSDTHSYFHVSTFWQRSPGKHVEPARPLVAILALMVIVGWAVRVHKEQDIRELYFAVYALVVMLYAVRDHNQVGAVMPFVYYYLLVGLRTLAGLIRKAVPKFRLPVCTCAASALLLANLLVCVTHGGMNIRGMLTTDATTDQGLEAVYPDDWAARFIAARRLKAAAAPGSVVMCERGIAESLHMVCGLPMTPMPRRYEPYVLMREAERRADYVVGTVGMPRFGILLTSVERGRSPLLEVLWRIEVGEAVVVVLKNSAPSRGKDGDIRSSSVPIFPRVPAEGL